MNKHTPLPWKVEDSWEDYIFTGPGGEEIVFQDGPHQTPTLEKADAAFIVRACNSYYDMLEALERVTRVTWTPASVEEFGGYCIDSKTSEIVRSAIAKAKGEQSA